ncbi:holo-ACP synthase [Alteromonas aestuariivivens]|uniref:Holo-[acyl-carrier-protein] synthase n=1 Tax=Alteromonas aestuariivivens TaxID=1938339 RepID=A0A3D8MC68_9ALTE|nr:holo-ACP synthase [Alteromonas aestuariivivens]RDV28086.1 holo-ACP synthase [Alteromonas aestuariivivens]
MAIVGLGTDIVEIARVEQNLARTPRLAERVLTPFELEIFHQHTDPARYLAKRFAAKEAAVKALGTGIGRGISWQHITVSNNELGAPSLTFSDGFLHLCEARGINHALVSISDEQHYAVATVVLESRG